MSARRIEERAIRGRRTRGSLMQNSEGFGCALGFLAGRGESVGELLNAGITAIGIFGEGFHDDALDRRRNRRHMLARARRENVKMLVTKFAGRSYKGHTSCEPGIHDNSQ